MQYDTEQLIESLTQEEIINILNEFGAEEYKTHSKGLIFKTVCHKGDTFKLYYYENKKVFVCYTDCDETFNIIKLAQKVMNLNYYEALEWINEFVGREYYNFKPKGKNPDLIWINKLKKQPKTEVIQKKYNKEILTSYVFDPHIDFLNEGINCKTQRIFQVGYDVDSNRIIIPIYNQYKELVSIKGRVEHSKEDEVDNKYLALMPYNKSHILYGLHQTLPFIQEEKKILVFESEKSVMLAYQFGYSFSVAIGGKSFSDYQVKKCIELSPEVIIALDKDVDKEYYKKIITLFKPYVKLSIIYDNDNLLNEKDSPVDKGKDVFKKLYDNRYKINT